VSRIGIDYTSAARQRAGIGRYSRELVGALLALEAPHEYALFAAVGGLRSGEWAPPVHPHTSLHTLPISDEWLARIWHRLRLPLPVEWATGRLDVFYSPDFVLPPTRRGTRTLLTVHDLSFLHYPDHFVPRLVQYLNRVVPESVARADLVLADSAASRTDLVERLGVAPAKVRVLYGGVSARFAPSSAPGEREHLQARYGFGRRPYVLSVGTLQPRKNYLRLIRAFVAALPRASGIATELVIAGGRGWLYQPIVDEAAKYPECVRVLGFVDDTDLPALYRHAVAFAFPSLYEGFGLPVLEAMACGVPVVCSDTSSLPEVVGDAALLVDPLDTDALAGALVRLLSDGDLRHRLVRRGLAQAATFTWQKPARELLSILTSLAER
jgi:glycosyltransferase involved in cell wall biosynthesis